MSLGEQMNWTLKWLMSFFKNKSSNLRNNMFRVIFSNYNSKISITKNPDAVYAFLWTNQWNKDSSSPFIRKSQEKVSIIHFLWSSSYSKACRLQLDHIYQIGTNGHLDLASALINTSHAPLVKHHPSSSIRPSVCTISPVVPLISPCTPFTLISTAGSPSKAPLITCKCLYFALKNPCHKSVPLKTNAH